MTNRTPQWFGILMIASTFGCRGANDNQDATGDVIDLGSGGSTDLGSSSGGAAKSDPSASGGNQGDTGAGGAEPGTGGTTLDTSAGGTTLDTGAGGAELDSAAGGTQVAPDPVIATNPVISIKLEDNADPEIMYYGGKYYIYPTTCPTRDWLSTYFKVYVSDDLQHWEDGGIILDVADVPWGSSQSWAPAIQEKNGSFYYYFCMNGNIGVATSTSPTGPFKNATTEPLIKGHIDPDVFVDDDGQAYLYYGQGTPRVRKLAADMVSFAGDEVQIPFPNFREGVYVFKRKGTYYMMASENDARDPSYQVSYGMGSSPLGPFTKQGEVLQHSGDFVGTGHNSVIQIPGTDDWYTVYHRHFMPDGGGQYREVCIQKLTFNDDGTIAPIIPQSTFSIRL